MKILIFDDNKRDREHLTNCLKTFFKNKDISYQITICQNKDELLNDIDSYDFLFLDIELGQENGINLGLELQKIEHHCHIIITTNYSKYAIDGYKIHAERYFIKPINQHEFDLEMNGFIKNYLIDHQAQGEKYNSDNSKILDNFSESIGKDFVMYFEIFSIICVPVYL